MERELIPRVALSSLVGELTQLFSRDWGHPSMTDDSLAERNFRFLGLGLLPDGVLEGVELVFRHRNEEGFEQYGGFPQASVDIVVIRVYRVPSSSRIGSHAICQVRGGKAKVLFKISDHLLESIDFVDELKAMGQ